VCSSEDILLELVGSVREFFVVTVVCLCFQFAVCFGELETGLCFELRLREKSCDALQVMMMLMMKD
jgi:hypothetical protein